MKFYGAAILTTYLGFYEKKFDLVLFYLWFLMSDLNPVAINIALFCFQKWKIKFPNNMLDPYPIETFSKMFGSVKRRT